MDNAYALAQWRQALLTAATTKDADTRERAQGRVTQWKQVLTGLSSGELTVGSRTPVRDVPAWVTPEVVRGGFVTGNLLAAGPLSEFEQQFALHAGVAPARSAIFEHALTDDGVRRLWTVLDEGRFDIDIPESAALLVMAWLVREGDIRAALSIVDEIRPFAASLRFLPRAASAPVRDPEIVWREGAGNVAESLRRKRVPVQVKEMNAVLAVWNPFADKLLAQWYEPVIAGQVEGPFTAEWLESARRLLDEFAELSKAHTPPRRHTRPQENAAFLRLALAAVVGGCGLTPAEGGRVRTAVEGMVRRRGEPTSAALRELREQQRAHAALPTHATLARLAAERLASVPANEGIEDVARFTVPVTEAEAEAVAIPAGTAMPRSVERATLRAKSGTLQELLSGGVIPSPEVLASLTPHITAQAVAEQYDDPALRVLMTRTYEAFRRRRSLLLLNLESQVRLEELPWVAAAAPHRSASATSRDVARTTLLRLADEATTYWPGTVLPNPLVAELGALASTAHLSTPLVEEIAADIFTGSFSKKFADAAALAATVLSGTLYARYYGFSDDELTQVLDATDPGQAFGALCARRASTPNHQWCTTCNGMVIEQQQILTTHNLAALVTLGMTPKNGWRACAEGAYSYAATLVRSLETNPWPHRMLKNLSYAWRQMVFHLSMLDSDEQAAFLDCARADAGQRPEPTGGRLITLLDDLARPEARPPLLGWTHERHWLLQVA